MSVKTPTWRVVVNVPALWAGGAALSVTQATGNGWYGLALYFALASVYFGCRYAP